MQRAFPVCVLVFACGSPDSDRRDGDCTSVSYWQDDDGDGFGSPETSASSCDVPANAVDNGDDCDDASAAVHPGVEDSCNEIDDDCDGTIDPNAPTWYPDADHDGYGSPEGALAACDPPDGYTANADDCDDDDDAIHPGATELCNGTDDDCEGGADEDFDADGDGYLSNACGGDDCDDSDAGTYPGAHDTCADGIDNDCENGDAICGSFAGEIDLATADAKIVSEGSNEEVGRLVEIGDVNADGIPDVFAAAELLHNHGGGYVFFGPLSGAHTAGEVGYALESDTYDSYTGRSIAVGDLDGDGFDDLGLGAPITSEVFVQLGPVTADVDLVDASIHATASDYVFGHGHDIGDVDDDGQDDLVIGSYQDSTGASAAGAVFIDFGPLAEGDLQPVDDHDAALWGFEPDQGAGRIVHVGGDFDGDGVQDLMLQAFGYTAGPTWAGAAFVVFGPVLDDRDLADSDAILVGETAYSWAAHSMSHGDIDGDGVTDALVGAPFASVGVANSGSAYVVLGPVTGVFDLADSAVIVRGSSSDAMTGTCVSAGDVDNDSHDDLLVGAPGDSAAGKQAGVAYFFYGPIAGTVGVDYSDAQFVGENDGDQAGTGLLVADLDLAGGADLLIGSPYEETSGTVGGAVYVVQSAE